MHLWADYGVSHHSCHQLLLLLVASRGDKTSPWQGGDTSCAGCASRVPSIGASACARSLAVAAGLIQQRSALR